MGDYLIFQLTAALGAMGEFAGHERRGSLIWPGRSALIGMFGAALGLRRGDDFSALDPLHMAVAIFDAGEALRDYHTVQTVPGAAARQPQSRPQALRDTRAKLNTTITLRDYRTAPLYGVGVWGGDLAVLAEALRRPVFTLYLGRKSCPLAAPLNPQIVAADSPEQALAGLSLPVWRSGAQAQVMASDDTASADRLETRHDIATDRSRWHFAPRQVAMRVVDIRPGGTP
ncbi:MAG: type I-E CRISPR-associated protein Cas5/CasD [Paracoccus sp. (in: a-proteobacteria)]|uniref:type I-E CRISPR-associated protein Cas5/CasD n=1 Tax=Paracoccus sp. TaxID=267 RepID=UPI0026E08962|nr:type I-E CRISPR-associated protein Cas5/CasD [Paracoccus sp. (in: a-proteobacteria)]MDO5632324.1 type I-E CRISPR-associated protein Cas5/CasD [Paracoccus sp. (in: a-proteobacteria)]